MIGCDLRGGQPTIAQLMSLCETMYYEPEPAPDIATVDVDRVGAQAAFEGDVSDEVIHQRP